MERKSNAGRPTKLKDAAKKAAIDYFDNFRERGDLIPSEAGLADHLNVSRSTVQLWAEKDEVFSGILERLKNRQERVLISGGLTKGDSGFNPLIAKMILTKHGYSDKQDVEMSGSLAVSEMSDDALNDRLTQLSAVVRVGGGDDGEDID